MTLDNKGRVFHGQLAEDIEKALFITFLPGFDGQPGHRFGKLERNEMNMVFVVRVMQHAVKIDLVDLGYGTDVAREQFVDFDTVLALQLKEMTNLDRTLAVADEQLHILLHRPLVDAEDANLAHVGVGHDLENVGQHVL